MNEQRLEDFFKKFRPSLSKRILNQITWWFDKIRIFFGGWERHLIWCPSQIRKKIKSPKGDLELYMRWRWDDPWSAHFIFTIDDETYWSQNLFKNYYFRDEEFKVAEKRLMQIYNDWTEGRFILSMEDLEDKKLSSSYFQIAPIRSTREVNFDF